MLTTLRSRLVVSSAAVVLVALGILAALVWRLFGAYFVAAWEGRTASVLRRAQAVVARHGPPPAAHLASLVGPPSTLAYYPGGGGAHQLWGARAGARDLGRLTAAMRRTALAGGSVTRVLGSALPGFAGETVLEAVPAVWQGRVRGVLAMVSPVQGGALLGETEASILAAGLLALLVGNLIWLEVARRLSEPLERLAALANRVAEGDFSARADVRAPAEYRQLGAALEAMASALAQADVARREFLASVAHELRTPLTTLRGTLDALVDGTLAADDGPRYLRKCLEEVDRLNRLLGDLLDLAKWDVGKLDLAIAPTNLGEVVSRAVLLWEMPIRTRGLRLEVSLPAQPVVVDADVDRLVQVVGNLLANGVTHGRVGGLLSVAVEPDEGQGYCRIVVTDDGQGIPPEQLRRVWERFYRWSPAGNARGTGLGLTIVRAIAEAHGGYVQATSEPGRTRFVVALPVRSPHVVPPPASEGA
jgi:two-component system sensor histidine kinase BaeS